MIAGPPRRTSRTPPPRRRQQWLKQPCEGTPNITSPTKRSITTVQTIFNDIADDYDLLNDALSLGLEPSSSETRLLLLAHDHPVELG